MQEGGQRDALAPGQVIGTKYRLESPLARGGMGAVWRARHLQLDVPVAVKFMDPESAASPVSRARFEREAKAAAGLKSPHIVSVHDYGLEGDLPYLVMELLQGEHLGMRLHRERRLTLAATAVILTQVAKGLRRVHEAGMVHRDLKPANIFLARIEDDEVVKVLDFGIAKDPSSLLSGRDVTATGEIIGSPHYMSPEQARCDRNIDPRSDIWSMGVITFRALTGELPFPAKVLGAVLSQVLADPIPLASQVAPDLPAEIDRFFARSLARDRNARFASLREMADELTALAQASAGATIPRAPSPSSIDLGSSSQSLGPGSGSLGSPMSSPMAAASAFAHPRPLDSSRSGEAPLPASGARPVFFGPQPVAHRSDAAPIEETRTMPMQARGSPSEAAPPATGSITIASQTGGGAVTSVPVGAGRSLTWIGGGAAAGLVIAVIAATLFPGPAAPDRAPAAIPSAAGSIEAAAPTQAAAAPPSGSTASIAPSATASASVKPIDPPRALASTPLPSPAKAPATKPSKPREANPGIGF
ncbi:MAG: serine/threonine-protein kinase [Byssovorax sp.]